MNTSVFLHAFILELDFAQTFRDCVVYDFGILCMLYFGPLVHVGAEAAKPSLTFDKAFVCALGTFVLIVHTS